MHINMINICMRYRLPKDKPNTNLSIKFVCPFKLFGHKLLVARSNTSVEISQYIRR